jgi:hypothetical protein
LSNPLNCQSNQAEKLRKTEIPYLEEPKSTVPLIVGDVLVPNVVNAVIGIGVLMANIARSIQSVVMLLVLLMVAVVLMYPIVVVIGMVVRMVVMVLVMFVKMLGVVVFIIMLVIVLLVFMVVVVYVHVTTTFLSSQDINVGLFAYNCYHDL